MPTIWDKDVLIFCCSQLIAGMSQGRELKQYLMFNAYNFLASTNRSTGQRGYDLLVRALERLRGVQISTNIETGGQRVTEVFGLIESGRVAQKTHNDKTLVVELKLSDWLYRAITDLEVLTLDRDYFRLTGGLERRIYELCRKHCGDQPSWKIGLALLHKKSGANTPLKKFRYAIRQLVESDQLPRYWLRYHRNTDQLTVYLRSSKGDLKELKDMLGI